MAAARFDASKEGEIREGEAISKIETKSDLPLSLFVPFPARLRIVPVIAADALGSSLALPPKRAGSMGKTGGKIRSGDQPLAEGPKR